MSGVWQETSIDGVLKRTAAPIADERGSFMEIWRESLTHDLGETFVQANLSRSRSGVLRGMHFHRRQVDLWILLEGHVVAATTDLRPVAQGGRPTSAVTELRPGDSLVIPRRVAHGFWALQETMLLYLVSNEYDGTDELGFAWNDPHAGIPWPAGEPILSGRDQANPPLAEFEASLRQHS